MTDVKAPERITLQPRAAYGWRFPERVKYGTEYIRKDLHDALAKERDELKSDIARLKNENARLGELKIEAETDELKAGAEVERLREALKPFAKSADGRRRKDMMGAVCFGQDVLLAARNALQCKGGE